MNKIVITTDSGSNPRDNSNMIPCMIIDEKNQEYFDSVKLDKESDIPIITPESAFDKAIKGERLHTAAPSFPSFVCMMEKHLQEGYDIVHLAMSSGISAASVNGARVVADDLNDTYDNSVNVIDTLTGGCGGTIINDYANNLLKQNKSINEVIENLNRIKKNIIATYYISKVEGFVKSGRAPQGARLSDKLLLRYRIDTNDKGKLYPRSVYRGKNKVQFFKYLKNLVNNENKYEYDPNYLAILITRLNEIDIEEVKDYFDSLQYFNKDLIKELKFTSAIASYGVEDQFGIGLLKKR